MKSLTRGMVLVVCLGVLLVVWKNQENQQTIEAQLQKIGARLDKLSTSSPSEEPVTEIKPGKLVSWLGSVLQAGATWTNMPGFDAPPRTELAKVDVAPAYVIEPPDILSIDVSHPPSKEEMQLESLRGEHLVRPDGSIGLGKYGNVSVSGMTVNQAKAAIEQDLSQYLTNPEIDLSVWGSNSKVYYLIVDGGSSGDTVWRFPLTGKETVLDAVGQITGPVDLPSLNKLWIARVPADGKGWPIILPINWKAITQEGNAETNYQLLAGDRLYVKSSALSIMGDCNHKAAEQPERFLGIPLLSDGTLQNVLHHIDRITGPLFFGRNGVDSLHEGDRRPTR
jgi:protein involved in polysaccharide export with SLBB domain